MTVPGRVVVIAALGLLGVGCGSGSSAAPDGGPEPVCAAPSAGVEVGGNAPEADVSPVPSRRVVIMGGGYTVHGPAGQGAWLYEVTAPATVQAGTPLELDGIRRVRLDDGASGAWPFDFDAG